MNEYNLLFFNLEKKWMYEWNYLKKIIIIIIFFFYNIMGMYWWMKFFFSFNVVYNKTTQKCYNFLNAIDR